MDPNPRVWLAQPVPAAKLKPGTSGSRRTLRSWREQGREKGGRGEEIPESLGCNSLKRRLNSTSPAQHTAPSPQDIWPQTLACSKDAVKALPTLTKNRWCFHVKGLLLLLLKPKAPLPAPCWDRAGICTPLQTPAHIVTNLDKASLTPAGLQPCTRSSLLPARGARPQSRLPCPALSQRPKAWIPLPPNPN